MKELLVYVLDAISSWGIIRVWIGGGLGALMGAGLFYLAPQVAVALKPKEDKPSSINVQQTGTGNVQNNFFGPSSQPTPATSSSGKPSQEASRIVVSKFAFVPDNESNLDLGYSIRLHLINRGKGFGYAPLLNFSYKSRDAPFSQQEIDSEMASVTALSRVPPDDRTREQVEVGVDHYSVLPLGPSREAYLDIIEGRKMFYLFVALNYRDDTLPSGKYWISEFCAFQTKELFPNFQLCRGHNGVRLSSD